MNLYKIYCEIQAMMPSDNQATHTFNGKRAAITQVLEKLTEYGFDQPGTHAKPWGVDDVHNQIEGRYQPITNEQAMQVIEYTYAKHDCGVGVNYDVLDERIEELGFDVPLTDEDESEEEEE